MGVSGCGKSSVGKRVADHLGWVFLEGDTLHPQANIDKMHAGHALDDADRRPWLAAIGRWLDARRATGESSIVTCSALKQSYRDQLSRAHPGVGFIWLRVGRKELQRRLHSRTDHFMPPDLLDSQLATLEPTAENEPAFTVDASGSIEDTVRMTIATACRFRRPPRRV